MTKYFTLILFVLSICSISTGQERRLYIEGYDRLRYSIEEIRVSPGIRIELTFKTVSELPESQMVHNWLLLKKDVDLQEFVARSVRHEENEYIDPELTGKIVATTSMLGGGEQETIRFTAPQDRGEYPYVCTFPGHYAAGMKGTLIVE